MLMKQLTAGFEVWDFPITSNNNNRQLQQIYKVKVVTVAIR